MPTLAPIKCGLFQFNIVDYHAVLGLPIGASSDQVRENYLKITRLLFPDIRHLNTLQENELADQLLSKLVNPSYENLFKNKSARSEHLLVLQQIGTRLSQGGDLRLKSKKAQEWLQAEQKGNIDAIYKKYINGIANRQYENLNKALQNIALMSEFNLVYLKLKQGAMVTQKTASPEMNKAKAEASTHSETGDRSASEGAKQELSPEDKIAKLVEPYIRRGKQFIDKQDYTKAIKDLRDALKLDAQNSQAHTLLGLAYVKQNQLGMAKIHINKALQLDPKNEMALEGKRVLEKLLKQSQENDKGSRGLLGSLFGKKKK